MEFSGFTNGDFEFFKKKGTMVKPEYDEKKEELKRRFREFCYQIQKHYHSITGDTLLLDKDFQGLNKNKDRLSAKTRINGIDYFILSIDLCQENITVNLISPPDGEMSQFDEFKNLLETKKDMFARFFKENRHAFIMLFRLESKKTGDDIWSEEYKFQNNELATGDYNVLIDNINRIQTLPGKKRFAGVHIKMQFSKSDIIRTGKNFPARICTEVIKLQNFCNNLK